MNTFWEPCRRASGRMEWTCPCGVGHGNHDHGCCAKECCSREDFPDRPLTVIGCNVDGVRLEYCNGPIPDRFGLIHQKISELELPDTKVSDEEFEDFLSLYRHASPWFAYQLLEESK